MKLLKSTATFLFTLAVALSLQAKIDVAFQMQLGNPS
jgi:hypothetical protein